MRDIKVLKGEIDLLSQLMLQLSRDKLPADLVERFGRLIAYKKQELEDLETKYISSLEALHKSIDEVKRKLSIDFDLSYDFGFIHNRNVKLQLEADNRAMVKARLGISDGRICFETYCKYAHFQLEELINYYYSLRFAGQEKELNNHFGNIDPDKQAKSVSEIPFSKKNEKLRDEFNPKGYFVITRLNNFRNVISHRCTIDKIDEDNVLVKYKSVKDKGWNKLSYEEKALKNNGLNIEFIRREDFAGLNTAFEDYFTLLSKEIIKVQKDNFPNKLLFTY